MEIKRLTLVFSVVTITILVIAGFVSIMTKFNEKETVFIEYVRKKPKRTHCYAWHPISKDYPWPDFANIKKLTFLRLRERLYRIKLETYAPIPKNTKDILSFAIFFDTPSIEGVCDTGVMYANKNYPYRHAPDPPSPNGGVFRIFIHNDGSGSSISWIGGIKALMYNSTIIIDFAGKLTINNSKQLKMVVVHYLPASIKLPKDWSVWSCVGCDVLRIDPDLEEGQIFVPLQP